MMKYNIMQDLVIVGGGAFLMVSGALSREPVNIVIAGVFFLFGLATLVVDIRRG
jgi:hypothetical protein